MTTSQAFAPFLFLRRGRVWTIVYPHPVTGKKKQRATKFKGRAQEPLARKVLAEFIQRRQAGAALAGEMGDDGPMTVSRWAKKEWLEGRKKKGVGIDDYESKLDLHILPHMGGLRLDAVTEKHVEEVMDAITHLAPRTQRHVYFTMHAMFERAVPRLLLTNPCSLREEDLPAKQDADPEWRATADFSKQEVQAIVTDPRIPWDRRTFYAVMFLSGARFGEIAALRLRHYTPELQPLGRLQIATSYNTKKKLVKGVKTDNPRLTPVHPWLNDLLAEWLADGWKELMGREPGADDLLVPSRRGNNRSVNHMLKKFHQDLDRVGLRRRRQHDARRTFITLARVDGARKDLLRLITHGPEGDIIDVYSEMPWPALCEEVAKLNIAAPESPTFLNVVALPKVAESDDLGCHPGCHGQIHEQMSNVSLRGGRDLKTSSPAGQSPTISALPRNRAEPGGRASGETPPNPASEGPGESMATLATHILRRALDALDRGRLDHVRSILQNALDAEQQAALAK